MGSAEGATADPGRAEPDRFARARLELDRLEAMAERVEIEIAPAGVTSLDRQRGSDAGPHEALVARCVGQGPPVVLLHGGSGSWNHWVRTIPALAANFRVIAIDLPGFGDSSLPRTVRSAHDLAQCTAYAIGRLVPPGGFGLVGFSFGGIIAGLVAAQRRSRATRLVLVAAGGLGLAGNVEGTLVAVPRHATREERFAAHRHNLAVLMISDPAKVDDLAVVLHDENVAKARFRTGSIPASTTLADALPAVRGRITYLAGERDAFGRDNGDRRGRLLRALRPDVEYVPVADAGHWAMYEQPETVNALLLERLTSG